MSKPIEIDNRQTQPGFTRQIAEMMRRCVKETMDRFDMLDNCEVYISLVSPHAIRRLNAQYRDMDSVTDVLSFPTIDWQGARAGHIETLPFSPDRNIETGRIMLGDVIICYQRAMEQAGEYGHEPVRELGFLSVHGVLHLMGFDHQTNPDEERMNAIAESVLHALNITRIQAVVQDDEK